MKRRSLLFIILLVLTGFAFSQDIQFVRKTIETLSSPDFYGRGYVNNGDSLAAAFLAQQLKSEGLESPGNAKDYLQSYVLKMNTFPGEMDLSIDKAPLVPGKDFFIDASSISLKGDYKAIFLSSTSGLSPQEQEKKINKKKLNKSVIIIDTGYIPAAMEKLASAASIIVAVKNLGAWDVSGGNGLSVCPIFYVSREKIPERPASIGINVENVFYRDYKTQNVMGMIRGTKQPDSFIVFTAHYDHLGMMGKNTLFPGAHDNASGCAMLLDLAAYYSQENHKPDYSILFMFFSGEEAGLKGSDYSAHHPVVPLKKISFLLNLDMVSTGSEGITVVNGLVLKEQFDRLKAINDSLSLLSSIAGRGEAANSDHYWFTKEGVKSFFIYTRGPEWKEYHNINDVSKGLPLTEYEDLFKLCTLFVGELMHQEK